MAEKHPMPCNSQYGTEAESLRSAELSPYEFETTKTLPLTSGPVTDDLMQMLQIERGEGGWHRRSMPQCMSIQQPGQRWKVKHLWERHSFTFILLMAQYYRKFDFMRVCGDHTQQCQPGFGFSSGAHFGNELRVKCQPTRQELRTVSKVRRDMGRKVHLKGSGPIEKD